MKAYASLTLLGSVSAFGVQQKIAHAANRIRAADVFTGDVLQRRTTHPPATNIPANWTYVGCYNDVPGQRALGPYTLENVTVDNGQFYYLNGANATNGGCIDTCLASGYTFAGTMYYSQCECSYGINSEAVLNEAGCDTDCDGNSVEACGGGNYVSVYTNGGTYRRAEPATDLPTNWTYKGCYTDKSEDGGPLVGDPSNNYNVLGQNLNASTCISFCTDGNYTLAGLRGEACICGNEQTPTSLPTNSCIEPCGANKNETCGADQKITIYQFGAAAAGNNGTNSGTGSGTGTDTGTGGGAGGNNGTDTNTGGGAGGNGTDAGTNGTIPDGNESGSGLNSTVSGRVYEGCYIDVVDFTPLLNGAAYLGQDDLTHASCKAQCAGYQFFGIDNGVDCRCGNEFAHPLEGEPGACTTPTSGSARAAQGGKSRARLSMRALFKRQSQLEEGGGVNRISVWRDEAYVDPVPNTTPSATGVVTETPTTIAVTTQVPVGSTPVAIIASSEPVVISEPALTSQLASLATSKLAVVTSELASATSASVTTRELLDTVKSLASTPAIETVQTTTPAVTTPGEPNVTDEPIATLSATPTTAASVTTTDARIATETAVTSTSATPVTTPTTTGAIIGTPSSSSRAPLEQPSPSSVPNGNPWNVPYYDPNSPFYPPNWSPYPPGDGVGVANFPFNGGRGGGRGGFGGGRGGPGGFGGGGRGRGGFGGQRRARKHRRSD